MPVYEDEQKMRYFYITKAEDEYGTLVGRFASKTSEHDPKAVEYKNNEGVVSYRHYHPSIGGVITGISVKEKPGKKGNYFVWEIVMDGGQGETFVMSVNLKSSSSNSIMHRLPNCNLKDVVRFIPYYFADKEKIVTGVMQQDEDGKWVKIGKFWQYDEKANKMTNGMPDMVVTEDKVTGKKEYDDKAQNAFMWDYYKKNILPVLEENGGTTSVAPEPTKEAPQEMAAEARPETNIDDVEEDDLPF